MMKSIYITLVFCLLFQFGNAQCYPDRHSTTWFDGWISCETSQNPNSAYGDSHWIMYDLGFEYELKESVLWNANEPDNIDFGIQEYHVDYSLDGTTWTNLGTYTLNQAPGSSIYEGEDGPNFSQISARYVLITPTSNYGGSCYGFSELKINITDPLNVIDDEDGFNALVYPNPFINDVTLRIVSLDSEAPITYALYDILGRQILSNSFALEEDTNTYPITLNGNTLSIGIYILKVEQGNNCLLYTSDAADE